MLIAAEHYNAQVAAVLEQRARLRGHPPLGDQFDGIDPDHPIMTADPHAALDGNLTVLASLLEPDDIIVDVGGGAGRISLALALRCRELVNVEPSSAMRAGFTANAARAELTNASVIPGGWPMADPPIGTVALVSHVMYLETDVVPFIEQLEIVGPRRVIIVVNDPAPPTWHHVIFELLHGEPEAFAPGHVELADVLWEMGRRTDVRYLDPLSPIDIAGSTPEEVIDKAVVRYATEQWTHWPLTDDLDTRLREIFRTRFDELFVPTPDGFGPGWVNQGHEVLLTWGPGFRR